MIWTAFLALLLAINVSSEFAPVCPESKGKTYHVTLLPNTDFYVCVDGSVSEYIKCDFGTSNSKAKCESDDPCCGKYISTKYIETTPKPIGRKTSIETPYKPIFTQENIMRFAESFFKDYVLLHLMYLSLNRNSTRSTSEMVTPTTDEPKIARSEDVEITIKEPSALSESNAVKKIASNAEPTTSPATEIESNIDVTEVSSTKYATEEYSQVSTELPTNITNSNEKLKEFTRQVIVPIIKDVVNDYSKMSKLASLFRKYFQSVVPLATDVLEQIEDYPGSGIKVPREKVIDTVRKIQDAKPLFQNATLEIMPSILHKLGDHMELFLDTMEEIEQRFQINFIGMPFRFFFLYLDYSNVMNKTSTEEFITFQRGPEVRRDIEVMSKVMTEVAEDQIFIEELNPTAIMIQLLFF